jgi:hypothetical protein
MVDLIDTCTGIKCWLPEPEWRPGWRSEAAGERANQERGPNGPWGQDPVRGVYTAGALYLELVMQSMRENQSAMCNYASVTRFLQFSAVA